MERQDVLYGTVISAVKDTSKNIDTLTLVFEDGREVFITGWFGIFTFEKENHAQVNSVNSVPVGVSNPGQCSSYHPW